MKNYGMTDKDAALNTHRLPTLQLGAMVGGSGTWMLWSGILLESIDLFTEVNATTITILDNAIFTGEDIIFKFQLSVWHVKVLDWGYLEQRDGTNIRAILQPTHNAPIWWEYAYSEEDIDGRKNRLSNSVDRWGYELCSSRRSPI